MDLPRRSFSRSRQNCLSSTVHPRLGFAWTNGRSVYLINLDGGKSLARKLTSDKLNEIESNQNNKIVRVAWVAADLDRSNTGKMSETEALEKPSLLSAFMSSSDAVT